MKKLFVGLLLGVILLCGGCGLGPTSYQEIDYRTMMDKFDQKEDFILFIGSEDCNHCSLYKVTLEEVIKKYHMDIFYIDISKLSKEEKSKLISYVNYSGTPTTAFIKKGEETSIYDRIDGNQPYDKVVEKLRKQGYIK